MRAVALLAICLLVSGPVLAAEPIRIAEIDAFSGPFADQGIGFQNHVRMAVDDINARGEVPAGHGYVEMHDDDDDLLHARVEWIVEDGVDRGSLRFHGGSGKWRGATGHIMVDLWGAPARAGTPMPPPGPIEFCGFIEGEGQLELPHFPA